MNKADVALGAVIRTDSSNKYKRVGDVRDKTKEDRETAAGEMSLAEQDIASRRVFYCYRCFL